MPLNAYLVETLVAVRLAEDREAAARRAAVRRARGPAALRVRVGAWLIDLGYRLAGPSETPSHAH